MVAALVLFIGSLRPNVILWTIEHEDSAIGLSLIRQIDREKGRATVAVLIGERSEQRKGFALEAAAIRNDFAFGQLELRSLRATVRSENRASRRLLERAGYKLIGTAEDAGVGASGDALLFELQRSGHEQQRETAG
jgi:RimJ/RimL family protein N-acetyltransferase